jgi:hypothetical protein
LIENPTNVQLNGASPFREKKHVSAIFFFEQTSALNSLARGTLRFPGFARQVYIFLFPVTQKNPVAQLSGWSAMSEYREPAICWSDIKFDTSHMNVLSAGGPPKQCMTSNDVLWPFPREHSEPLQRVMKLVGPPVQPKRENMKIPSSSYPCLMLLTGNINAFFCLCTLT